ncbi:MULTISPECIES: hypothetical protein [unclassified Microbulbifer]|uniref:hypothetical protein n=1 Tax=unclassified Microbulbifer TaxID=2619833 RepID=UPI001E28F194|nr:hypothetical protein [Microbulbifer sp. YPW16]UHQ55962.1 hypothetical protein LVE68_02960 [Microbulbifer sp. YPW16]
MDALSSRPLRVFWFLCLLLFTSAASAKEHPSYLTPQYCDGLVQQFVDSGMRSLGKYVNDHFDPKYRGGIRNTIHFLKQRSSWISECDAYLQDTANGSAFYNRALTDNILSAIDALARELQLVRDGVEYSDENGVNNPTPFIKERYEQLAEYVDEHHTRFLMKKQFQ